MFFVVDIWFLFFDFGQIKAFEKWDLNLYRVFLGNLGTRKL